ncbi:hypothetical protein FWF74_01245 [Candidatus Saccharibacteria bacterium]|nr:hypothetical protein [Candidatus Saccharibacteria bacterium]MCL1963032.1 hypothetical protein [Candidatus Saccharibacteria bacterium]
MIKKILSTLLLAVIVAASNQLPVFAALFEGYSLADGTVTDIQPWSSHSDIKKFCKISYDVKIDGKKYSEENTDDTNDFCYVEIGDTIKIKYLKSDPRDHKVASKFEIENMSKDDGGAGNGPGSNMPNPLFFIGPFVLVFVVVLAIIIKTFIAAGRKLSDTDGDGLAHDEKPATAEQKKLIQEGFRKLGVYHDVKKKMTQAQARETLREIDNQLKQR